MRYQRSRPEYEIVQHGYNHITVDGVREGMLTDIQTVNEKIKARRSIIKECFDKETSFFVVPCYDDSAETKRILKHYFKKSSLHGIGKRRISWSNKLLVVGRRFLSNHFRSPNFRDGAFLLLEYPDPIFSMFNDYSTMKEMTADWLAHHDIMVLFHHYWEYFWDWDEPNHKFLAAWHDIVSSLFDRNDVEITPFSNLFALIYSKS